MNRAIVAIFTVVAFLTLTQSSGGNRERPETGVEFPDPVEPTGAIGFPYQAPMLSEEGVIGARPADSACDHACGQAQASSAAVANPGMDMEELRVRFDEIDVWGFYVGAEPPGSPPAEDAFTVRAYLPSGSQELPGLEACSATAVVSSREVVDSILGWDIYHHTLQLSTPCLLTAPANKVYWVEVFNDTGPADDWFWLAGWYDWLIWPPDCCDHWNPFGTGIDSSHAPGESWADYSSPLAFRLKANFVGEAQDLRLSKTPGGEILLQWAGDCGAGVNFSVYRGDLGEGYSSLEPEPGLCDVSGTSATVPVGDGADFFLVAPWVDANDGTCILWGSMEHCRTQGSYGTDSDGVLRAQPPYPIPCYYGGGPYGLHECAQ